MLKVFQSDRFECIIIYLTQTKTPVVARRGFRVETDLFKKDQKSREMRIQTLFEVELETVPSVFVVMNSGSTTKFLVTL